jgi:signal transduction histidine kinase
LRPLARKILLTQGVVISLVFGVSTFAFLHFRAARTHATHMHEEFELWLAHEKLETELRDVERSRAFYFQAKRVQGERLVQLRDAFYQSLERLDASVEELAEKAAGPADLGALISGLRRQLTAYRKAVATQEATLAVQAMAREGAANQRAEQAWAGLLALTDDSRWERQQAVKNEIDSLHDAARQGRSRALQLSVLALAIGLLATFWLTRSIHRPVRAMRSATEALSRGEFDRRLDVRNRDELGDLARAFNEMAARLQELDELKSGFVSMVSHDLKTPLTSMKEAVDLLSEGVGGELTLRQRRLLSIAREGMERLNSYVQGILDVFRFEAGHVHLVREPLSLTEVVAGQANLAEARCREAGIRLQRKLDPDLPPVEGDRFRLGQVVANLLDNAVKFTAREGKIVLRTGVKAWRDDMAVVLEVEDTGIGISVRDQKHVFDKFFQAANTRGHKVRGAGLGLAIVKNLVEAHDGEVSVKSAPGRGTTFRVVLPAASRIAAEQEILAG